MFGHYEVPFAILQGRRIVYFIQILTNIGWGINLATHWHQVITSTNPDLLLPEPLLLPWDPNKITDIFQGRCSSMKTLELINNSSLYVL